MRHSRRYGGAIEDGRAAVRGLGATLVFQVSRVSQATACEFVMKAISLLYHDAVTDKGHIDASGFPGPEAAPYKLDVDVFTAHLHALAASIHVLPGRVTDYLARPAETTPLFLTFDDGGKSAATEIAPLLATLGWFGHFFVTTDCIGRPEFVDEGDIKALHAAGHVIGSHSASHPGRMALCPRSQLLDEWSSSKRRLENIVQEPVLTASVPGGFFSQKVADTASEAGLKVLFTSEPIKRMHWQGGCVVLGRYNIWRGMESTVSADLANSMLSGAQVKQYGWWNIKKLLKAVGGRHYLVWRRMMLDKST